MEPRTSMEARKSLEAAGQGLQERRDSAVSAGWGRLSITSLQLKARGEETGADEPPS